MGRNGAGKTTLFNCISKEISCDGEIALYDGADDILDFSQIGFTYAHPILPEFLTGYEFLKFYIDINKDKIKDKKSIPEYFDMIKIKEEDWYRLIKDYSHGMKNKMQMICFLITKPPVILLDEPLTSFDIVVAHEIKQMLKAMKQDHIIIFSTHILELAEDLCDEIVILNQGKLEAIDHNMIGAPEFEEKIFEALKRGNSMINTIIQGRMLVFVQQVNVLLYYVRKLPFVGEKIPYRLYGETDIKKAIGAIPVVFSVIGAFVGTFLYFLLMIKLPANWIQGFWEKKGFL